MDEIFSQIVRNNLKMDKEKHNLNMGLIETENLSINRLSIENEALLNELESLGVVEMTFEEVENQFNNGDSISTRDLDISVEDYSNIKWYKSSTYNYYFGGEKYEAIIVRGIPSGYSSSLYVHQTTLDYFERDSFKVGEKNLIKYVINRGFKTYLKELTRDIPFAGTAMTVYNVLKATLSGVSTTDTINEIHTTETIDTGTEIKFVYANKASNSSYYQNLQFITNRVDADVNWIVPASSFEGDSFDINTISGMNELKAEADKFGSSAYYACKYYSSNYQTQTDFVDVDIVILDELTRPVPSVEASFPIQLY